MKRLTSALLLLMLLLLPFAYAEQPSDGFTPDAIVAQSGSRGDIVRRAQVRLIELGYLQDDADAVFGRRTAAALKDWQTAEGYEPTGKLTAAQFRALCPDGLDTGVEGFDGAPGYEVYVSPAGEKYHRYDCYTIRSHPVRGMSEAQAVEEGYTPCWICKPDK